MGASALFGLGLVSKAGFVGRSLSAENAILLAQLANFDASLAFLNMAEQNKTSF